MIYVYHCNMEKRHCEDRLMEKSCFQKWQAVKIPPFAHLYKERAYLLSSFIAIGFDVVVPPQSMGIFGSRSTRKCSKDNCISLGWHISAIIVYTCIINERTQTQQSSSSANSGRDFFLTRTHTQRLLQHTYQGGGEISGIHLFPLQYKMLNMESILF